MYYTARANLSNFIRWVNNLEFVADNEVIMDYVNKAYNAISVDLDSWIKNTLMPSMQNIVSGVGIGVLNVVTVFKNFIIGIIVAIYLLASRKKFAQQAKPILYSILKPRWADTVLNEVLYADKMFGGFINGKIMDSAIIGVLCYIGCLIFKFPSALLVSVIIGVTNVIPFFGPFIGAVPATLLILIQNPIKALWFVLFILILQQLDGNIIGPKILGNTTGLSSFWVLFAILLFGGLWGFAATMSWRCWAPTTRPLATRRKTSPPRRRPPPRAKNNFPDRMKELPRKGFIPHAAAPFCVLLQLDDLQVFRHKQIAVEILPSFFCI